MQGLGRIEEYFGRAKVRAGRTTLPDPAEAQFLNGRRHMPQPDCQARGSRFAGQASQGALMIGGRRDTQPSADLVYLSQADPQWMRARDGGAGLDGSIVDFTLAHPNVAGTQCAGPDRSWSAGSTENCGRDFGEVASGSRRRTCNESCDGGRVVRHGEMTASGQLGDDRMTRQHVRAPPLTSRQDSVA